MTHISNSDLLASKLIMKSQCVICFVVLSNEASEPAKLQRHLKTTHPNLSDRLPEFIIGKSESLKKI